MASSPEATPREVAEWMVAQISKGGSLYQSSVAHRLRQQFGDWFVYRNKQRNWGISKEVLKEFNKLTTSGENDLVWVRSGQYWRRRKPSDKPGRMAR